MIGVLVCAAGCAINVGFAVAGLDNPVLHALSWASAVFCGLLAICNALLAIHWWPTWHRSDKVLGGVR